MLLNLQIKNYLLINELELDFYNGLTAITGETGSGKSITIDALMLLFGAKANNEVISKNKTQCSISATFESDNPNIILFLSENNYLEESDSKIITARRVIEQNGRSKTYINGISVNLNTLKTLGELLLDIHTQHASISLLKVDHQRILLDEFSGLTLQVNRLMALFNQVKQLEIKIKNLKTKELDLIAQKEELINKINELNELDLKPNEWENLNNEQKRLANAEFILQELELILGLVNNEHNGAYKLLREISYHLTKLSNYINLEDRLNLIEAINTELQELEHSLTKEANQIELNPEELLLKEDRIEQIFSLARKFKLNPEDILIKLQEFQAEHESLIHDSNLNELEEELKLITKEYFLLADKVHLERQKNALKLSRQVNSTLAKLSINGEFKINIVKGVNPQSYGLDEITYLVNFNLGQELKPLNKVISGGELSRLALALYVALSVNNPPELIVFDEIDVGIGGKTAHVVGALLHTLAKSKQVIAITHQAQAAALADNHLKVSKLITEDKVSLSEINYISNEDRVLEIARMIGGREITPTTIKHARELLS